VLAAAVPVGRAAASPPSPKALVDRAPARATYVLSRPDGRVAIRPHRVSGYLQRVRLLPDGRAEATVLVEPAPLRLGAPWPADPARWPPGIERWSRHDLESSPTPVVEALGRRLAEGSRTELEAADRILTWVSQNVRPVDEPSHDDSAAAALGTGEASCVGRSRLSAALLRAAGLPARTVHGLLVPRGVDRGAPLGSAEFALHRFVEVWIGGAGWLPSDPGESLHVVDTRHLVLAVDDESYDPEEQRRLRVTLSSAPGALRLLEPARAQEALLVRRALRPFSEDWIREVQP
jgi:transglutaminase-like putative cysteine protease